MTRIGLIAQREIRELLRQPAMLAAITSLFLVIGGLVLSVGLLFQLVTLDEEARAFVESFLPALGFTSASLEDVNALAMMIGGFLLLSQYLGISGVLAGHTVLHDRQCHTLPFLLLAPLSRVELLLGKVLGALALPTLLYLVSALVVMGILDWLPIAATSPEVLPSSLGWWISTLMGAPIWALAVSLICAIISAVARDVRTAQQGVWLIMFFATLAAGYLLVQQLPSGWPVQIGASGIGAALAATALFVGSRVISRDLGR